MNTTAAAEKLDSLGSRTALASGRKAIVHSGR